jgi:hypothetical protein
LPAGRRDGEYPLDDPATVEHKLGTPDARGEFAGARKVHGKPPDERWPKSEAYRIIVRRLPREPSRIPSVSVGEPETT